MPTYTDPDDRERQSTAEVSERVTVRVTQSELERVEQLVDDGIFPNRSEAIREGLRQVTHRYRPVVADGGEAGE